MNVTIFKKKLSAMSALLFIASVITLAKSIIQEEKYPLRNVWVIETSENKLSIAPEINQVSDQKLLYSHWLMEHFQLLAMG